MPRPTLSRAEEEELRVALRAVEEDSEHLHRSRRRALLAATSADVHEGLLRWFEVFVVG